MNEKRKRHQCPNCNKIGWLYRENNDIVCCNCLFKFPSKRKDDYEKVPEKWEV